MKKVLIGLVIALVAVAGLGFVGERVAAGTVANRVSDAVTRAVPGVGAVTTTVDGGLVAPQLARGTLSNVHVTIDGVPLKGGLKLDTVNVDLTDVSVSSPRIAKTVTAQANLATAQIQQLLGDGWKVTPQGDSLQVSTSGLFSVAGTVQPVVEAGELKLNLTDVTVMGVHVDPANIPAVIKDRLNGLTAGFGALPLGLKLTGVQVTSTGVNIDASGANVNLDQG